MDRLVVQIQGHSAQRQDWASLVTHFRQHRKELQNVRENEVLQALSNLNPSIHSVGYGCVLSLGLEGEKFKGSGDISNMARTWMLECNPEAMSFIGPEAASVCRALAGSAERNQALSARALLPLRTMISKCQPSPEHMTPAHAAALKAALGAKKYYTGLQILAQPLYLLDTSTGLTATDYLLYCYYGGLVCIGCKDYAKASDLLLLAVTTPTNVPDAIIVAAWNKYLLIHALRTGNVAEPPKHTPYVTTRQLREHANIHQFVKAYTTGNVAAMKAALEAEATELREEGVYGLAQQLYEKVVTRSIQQLTSTYLTLSLSDIAREARMDNADKAELHVLKMIDAGEMQASIDESAGMVRFQEEQEDTTPALLATLNQKMAEMMAMQQRLQAASREVGLEPKYLQPSTHSEKNPKGRSSLFIGKDAYAASSAAYGASTFDDL